MAEPWIENLKTRRLAITAELAALSTAAAGGKPNIRGDGVNVDHVGYKDGLYRELAAIDEQLTAAGESPLAGDDGVGNEETIYY